MSHRHTVSIEHVRGLLLGAQARGADCTALLTRAGIAPTPAEDERADITIDQFAALIRVLRRALRDEYFGLTSRRVRPGCFARCMDQAVRCMTLGEALRSAFSLYGILVDDFIGRLSVQGGAACLRFVQRAPSNARTDWAIRATMLFAFAAASWLIGRRIQLLGVDYTHGMQPNETARIYRTAIRQGQPYVSMSFDARWLAQPVVQNAQSLHSFLRNAPANLISGYRDETALPDRICRLLRKRLDDTLPSLQQVAELLAVTPQTLRRRLQDEGRGFRAIKDEVRRDAAIDLLLKTGLSLPEVAQRVGFSEASTFHRAFKQWTGEAPGAYRAAHAH
ncbi:AraC family transcriptional regulator [Variovorax paradoxus]|uniref:AraC family transcriptional regulator n=1 Tax=Variovorax paradoxus TaxID=34073 RepID=UPI002479905A